MTPYRENPLDFVAAMQTGDRAWREQYSADERRRAELDAAFDAASTATRLPGRLFHLCGPDGPIDQHGLPENVEIHVRVMGTVYFPSLFVNATEWPIGTLAVGAGLWWVDGTPHQTAAAAIAALLASPRGAASISAARADFVADIEMAQHNHDVRVLWRRVACIVALLDALCVALLTCTGETGDVLGIACVVLLGAFFCVAFAHDGIAYDRKIARTYEKWLA